MNLKIDHPNTWRTGVRPSNDPSFAGYVVNRRNARVWWKHISNETRKLLVANEANSNG